jgi:hypothetical protein
MQRIQFNLEGFTIIQGWWITGEKSGAGKLFVDIRWKILLDCGLPVDDLRFIHYVLCKLPRSCGWPSATGCT